MKRPSSWLKRYLSTGAFFRSLPSAGLKVYVHSEVARLSMSIILSWQGRYFMVKPPFNHQEQVFLCV
jgi:hypothetical protein